MSTHLQSLNKPQAQIQHYSVMRLVRAVQDLSMARTLPAIMEIVRIAAREIAGADGATFVLRDGEQCYYADEDAISPLWKGQRFPIHSCISGWVMENRLPASIADVFQDPRIPAAAYRPTFVKSLAMVPIRSKDPIGAIGSYWATTHAPSPDTLELLQALANTTAVAMENVQVYAELEKRVKDRTAQLTAANQEMEAFSYSVSHDLRAPLRTIDGLSQGILDENAGLLSESARTKLQRIRNGAAHMGELIDDLLQFSRVARAALAWQSVNLSRLAQDIVVDMRESYPGQTVDARITPEMIVLGDKHLLDIVLKNLISNAWKFTSRQSEARIEFGFESQPEGGLRYFIRDNGDGFDADQASKIFEPFQRAHHSRDYPGTGIGLAIVYRIIQRHGGRVWGESEKGRGATFYFSLPPTPPVAL